MSALLLIFYWVVIPATGFLLLRGLWRHCQTNLQRGLLAGLAVFCFMGLVWMIGGGEKGRLDRQVRELCAKDGGVKVYETVRLPKEKFDKWGMVKPYDPTQKENALGPDYIYRWDRRYYRRGEPAIRPGEIAVARDWIQITRKSDMKILGEVIRYYRAGGDLPGPWMPSGYDCPPSQEANEIVLMKKIFVIDAKEAEK